MSEKKVTRGSTPAEALAKAFTIKEKEKKLPE